MVIQYDMDLTEKLRILGDAAKFDVSCSSSGVDRKNNGKGIGNSKACGICHSFAADGRCISLLKILFTNECIFNCRYCINRSDNDTVRTSFTPEEVCTLTMQFYRRNYIEGLFLSSGITHNPNYTMSQLVETVYLLREKYHFGGYIHLKAIPGAAADLIEAAGMYADRMSVNLELTDLPYLHRTRAAKLFSLLCVRFRMAYIRAVSFLLLIIRLPLFPAALTITLLIILTVIFIITT